MKSWAMEFTSLSVLVVWAALSLSFPSNAYRNSDRHSSMSAFSPFRDSGFGGHSCSFEDSLTILHISRAHYFARLDRSSVLKEFNPEESARFSLTSAAFDKLSGITNSFPFTLVITSIRVPNSAISFLFMCSLVLSVILWRPSCP